MAPPKQTASGAPTFAKDERVLCFHMEMLYEAKVLDVQPGTDGNEAQYKMHYKGWKASWDDWVPADRLRKYNDENRELAAQLLSQFKTLQSGKAGKTQAGKKPSASSKGGAGVGGSDLGSARGSEEATAMAGRTMRRVRDFDMETGRSAPNPQVCVLGVTVKARR